MADLKIGTTRPSKVYLGTTAVKKIYIGSTLVWSAGPTWDELFTQFHDYIVYNPDYETTLSDIGFEVFDSTIHSSDDSVFCIIEAGGAESEGQENLPCWFNFYDKSTYSSLLSSMSDFKLEGGFDNLDYNDMGNYIMPGIYYVAIPYLADETSGYVQLYRYER